MKQGMFVLGMGVLGLGIGLGLAMGGGVLSAQTAGSKVGFVNVDALFAAHPLGKQLSDLQTNAGKELEPLAKTIQTLQARGAALTPKEKQDLETTTTLYTAAQKKWQEQGERIVTPLNNDVNRFIGVTAKQNGFSVLINSQKAQELVVYAEEGTTDLTATVIKAMGGK